jgi:hypothetical protein
MDVRPVRLPNGTVIENVPVGTTQAQLLEQLRANGYDVSQFETPSAPEVAPAAAPPVDQMPTGRSAAPAWSQEFPNLYQGLVRTRQMVGPTVEMLGGVAGGALGTAGAPGLGTLAGAGAGYAGARQLLSLADTYLGLQPALTPQDALKQATFDIAAGGTMEAGGRVAGQTVSAGLSRIADLRQIPQQRAASLARRALGENLDAAQQALRAAPEGATAAQALADGSLYAPTAQALLQRAAAQAPERLGPVVGPSAGMTPTQTREATNQLIELAGGATPTATRAAREADINALNAQLLPQRDVVLSGINADQAIRQRLQAEAARMGTAASEKVEDVRRFTAAGERIGERARSPYSPDTGQLMPGQVAGQPRVPGRYTYMGELEEAAERVATQSAEGSLTFGEAGRFAQRALDSMAAHGLQPLKTEALERQLNGLLSNPRYAANRELNQIVPLVIQDIRQWTDAGGVIDAFALDALRRNSVSSAVRDLFGAKMTPTAQQELTASLLTELKPAIDDAITKASGSPAYVRYLEAYAKGRQAVEQRQLSAEALEMFERNPREFVDLVTGRNPKKVEEIFGPGNYDLVKQMSDSATGQLGKIAETAGRAGRATEQAAAGREAYSELLKEHLAKLRVPWGLSVQAAALNKGIDTLEKKVNRQVWAKLTKAAETASSFDELLRTLPAYQRTELLRAVRDPSTFGLAKGAVGRAVLQEPVNQLAPVESQNALIQ